MYTVPPYARKEVFSREGVRTEEASCPIAADSAGDFDPADFRFQIDRSAQISSVPNSQQARRFGKGCESKRLPSCAVTHLYF
jgi:hypothetical protein